MLKMSSTSTSLHVPSQLLSKYRDSFDLWKIGKFCHVFNSANFNSETVFGFGWGFQTSFVHRFPDIISAGSSRLESQVAIVCSESFADIIHVGQSISLNLLLLRSAAVECSLSIKFGSKKWINNFNNCFSKNSATKIILQWRHCYVKLISLVIEMRIS